MIEKLHSGRKQRWTKETVIEAIQEWNKIHGSPPRSTDWNVPVEKAAGGHRRWPPTSTVQVVFGMWSNAIVAAGFPKPINSGKRHNGSSQQKISQSTYKKVVRLLKEGKSAKIVALHAGVSDKTAERIRKKEGIAIHQIRDDQLIGGLLQRYKEE